MSWVASGGLPDAAVLRRRFSSAASSSASGEPADEEDPAEGAAAPPDGGDMVGVKDVDGEENCGPWAPYNGGPGG